MVEKVISFISLANKNCVKCGHLVPGAKQFFESCHFTAGNESCPAAKFKLGVGVNVEKASKAIADSIHSGDVLALQRNVNRLAGYDTEQSQPVLEAVFAKLADLKGLSFVEEDETDSEDGDAGQDLAADLEAEDDEFLESGGSDVDEESVDDLEQQTADALADEGSSSTTDEWKHG